jgi:hypothetical protein
VLDLAVRAALEARKPAYAQLPQRVCLHEDLLYSHVGIDPRGHADAIREALAFMQSEVTPELECQFCVQDCQTEFDLACGRLDAAEASARRSLALVEEEGFGPLTRAHYTLEARAKLCAIAFARGDWAALFDHVADAEELNARCDRPRLLAELLLWQALLARLCADEERGRRLVRRANALVGRQTALAGAAYFDALCAYHAQGEELETALKVRDAELGVVSGRGLLERECRVRVQRCRLLARLGRLSDADLAAAREAAGKLGDPTPHLTELGRIAAGG